MYQNIFYSRRDEKIHVWDDKKGHLVVPAASAHYAYRRRTGGRYKSIYGDSLEKIFQFDARDPELFESDVPVETKFLLDAYEDSDDVSTGHRVVYLDIETDSEGGFPDVKTGNKKITAISLYEELTQKYVSFVLDEESRITEDFKFPDAEIKSYTDEESLVLAFLNKWEEIGPTIITGWNTSGFDCPYLFNRFKRILGDKNAKRLSPIGVAYINKFDGELVVAGISNLDYLLMYKKFIGKVQPSYTLDSIGKLEVGMAKIVYDGNLNTLYKSDLNKYIEYNLNDVKIVVALDKKLQYIDLARRICHVGHIPYENFSMSSRYLEGAILMYLHRNKRIAPNKPMGGRDEYNKQLEDNEEGFSGAYVKDPVPGRYEWIYDLDLSSMYPSIIISLNISPETKVGLVENFDSEKWSKGQQSNFVLGQTQYNKEEFHKLLNDCNYSISSNGVIYKKDKMGVVPEVLTKWFAERKEFRKLAKKYAKEGDNDKYFFYNQRQYAWKILLNSLYGALGLCIWRFYDKDNAEAVTTTGVAIIKSTGDAINQFYKKELGRKYKIKYKDGKEEVITEEEKSNFFEY
jgi:DNA polymerase elongation subunit (family B)